MAAKNEGKPGKVATTLSARQLHERATERAKKKKISHEKKMTNAPKKNEPRISAKLSKSDAESAFKALSSFRRGK